MMTKKFVLRVCLSIVLAACMLFTVACAPWETELYNIAMALEPIIAAVVQLATASNPLAQKIIADVQSGWPAIQAGVGAVKSNPTADNIQKAISAINAVLPLAEQEEAQLNVPGQTQTEVGEYITLLISGLQSLDAILESHTTAAPATAVGAKLPKKALSAGGIKEKFNEIKKKYGH